MTKSAKFFLLVVGLATAPLAFSGTQEDMQKIIASQEVRIQNLVKQVADLNQAVTKAQGAADAAQASAASAQSAAASAQTAASTAQTAANAAQATASSASTAASQAGSAATAAATTANAVSARIPNVSLVYNPAVGTNPQARPRIEFRVDAVPNIVPYITINTWEHCLNWYANGPGGKDNCF